MLFIMNNGIKEQTSSNSWNHHDWQSRAPKPDAEFQRWMDRYLPFERQIMAERERREKKRQKRLQKQRRDLHRAFGDFCEASEGRAVLWKEEGFNNFEAAFEIASDAFIGKTAERYFRLTGIDAPQTPRLSEMISGLILLNFILTLNIEPIIGCCTIRLFVQLSSMMVNHLKHRAIRPLYYEREALRRRNLASDRRRIAKRTTTNDCPSKEAILEAYQHRKDSKDAAIKFGSLIHDLECYVDNSLKIAEGRIIGRNQGVKGWLADNIPVLTCKYTTIMRYKAAAKKLKQLVELPDPTPADVVLIEDGQTRTATTKETPCEQVLRAIAIYREIGTGIENATGIMEKIDIFLDPTRIEESSTLAHWRERYKNEITVRNKYNWWRRFTRKGDLLRKERTRETTRRNRLQ